MPERARHLSERVVDSDTNSSSLTRPSCNRDKWPPLLGGGSRCSFASVVVNADCSRSGRNDFVAVIGGNDSNFSYARTNSVILLNLGDPNKKWFEGPPLNEKRAFSRCRGGQRQRLCRGRTGIDTIERIRVGDLLGTKKDDDNGWKLLEKCRLSTRRNEDCAAAMVQNRFIVIVAGSRRHALSSVDVIDLASEHCHRVCSGPSLNVPRSHCAVATIGSRVYVVGGCYGTKALDSVEFLELDKKPVERIARAAKTKAYIAGLSWTLHKDLILKSPRFGHVLVQCGSCLVVAGGISDAKRVEVFDTQSYQSWNLEPYPQPCRDVGGMVAYSNGIAILSGLFREECLTLDWMEPKSRLFSQSKRNLPSLVASCFEQQRPPVEAAASCEKR